MQTGDVPLQRGQQPGCSAAARLLKIVAHRGASQAAPQNTLPAIRPAFDEGANLVEGDYWLTRDERIVCMLNDNTQRSAPDRMRSM